MAPTREDGTQGVDPALTAIYACAIVLWWAVVAVMCPGSRRLHSTPSLWLALVIPSVALGVQLGLVWVGPEATLSDITVTSDVITAVTYTIPSIGFLNLYCVYTQAGPKHMPHVGRPIVYSILSTVLAFYVPINFPRTPNAGEIATSLRTTFFIFSLGFILVSALETLVILDIPVRLWAHPNADENIAGTQTPPPRFSRGQLVAQEIAQGAGRGTMY
jgi:hypothetical protein